MQWTLKKHKFSSSDVIVPLQKTFKDTVVVAVVVVVVVVATLVTAAPVVVNFCQKLRNKYFC